MAAATSFAYMEMSRVTRSFASTPPPPPPPPPPRRTLAVAQQWAHVWRAALVCGRRLRHRRPKRRAPFVGWPDDDDVPFRRLQMLLL